MYSWELDEIFKKNNCSFPDFYSFEQLRYGSPQIKYSLLEETDDETLLGVWSDDNYKWIIHIAH